MKGHCPHLKKTVLLTKQHLWLQITLALFPPRPLDLQNEQGVTRHYEALPVSQLGSIAAGPEPASQQRRAYKGLPRSLISSKVLDIPL